MRQLKKQHSDARAKTARDVPLLRESPLSWWTLAGVLILAGILWAVYGRAVGSPFIFDDSSSVRDNPSIVRLWPLVGDAQQPGPLNPSKDMTTSGRPLVNLTLALNYHFGGLDPTGYHVFNLLVHLLAALLLWSIVRRTLRLEYFGGRFTTVSNPLAFLVAILWAVHPLQTETVIYVTQRTELMVGVFYLATLYGSLRYWDATSTGGRRAWLILTTLAGLAGMACKEVMATAPVLVLLLDRTLISGSFRRALRQSWPLYVGLALGWGLLLALNYDHPRAASAGFDLAVAPVTWWLTQTKVLWMYFKLVVWPWPLAIHYEAAYLTLATAWPWLLATALLGIGTLALLVRRNAIGLVGAWVLLILSPTLVVPIVSEMAAERRMYLPLAALITLAVVGGYWLLKKFRGRTSLATISSTSSTGPGFLAASKALSVISGVSAALALAWSLVDVHRLAAYHDSLTLWQEAARTQPNDIVAQFNLGFAYFNSDHVPEAIEHYQQALRVKPDYADAMCNLAVALAKAGRLPEATEQLEQAVRFNPALPEVHYNLANILAITGQPQQAIEHYRRAVTLRPSYTMAYNNLGKALFDTGQWEEAITDYRQALRLNPDLVEAHFNLGVALSQTGRLQEAIEQYQQALRLKPDYAEAYVNLGSLLHAAGQRQAAIEQYQKALQVKPDYAEAHANLGNVLLEVGQPQAALEHCQLALRSMQNVPPVHNNLGNALLALGRPQDAIEQYQEALRLNPDYAKAWTNLAIANAAMHRSEESKAASQKALDLARSQGQTALVKQIETWLNTQGAQQADSPSGQKPSSNAPPASRKP